MLRARVIEPAQCPWSSLVVRTVMDDGTGRIRGDYRRINAVQIQDTYPIPSMDLCIDSLGDSTIFKALYVDWGYSQVTVREQDRNKTAFCSASLWQRFIAYCESYIVSYCIAVEAFGI